MKKSLKVYNIYLSMGDVLITYESIILRLKISTKEYRAGNNYIDSEEVPIEKRSLDAISLFINQLRESINDEYIVQVNIIIFDKEYSNAIKNILFDDREIVDILYNNINLNRPQDTIVNVVMDSRYMLKEENEDTNLAIELPYISSKFDSDNNYIYNKNILIINTAIYNDLRDGIGKLEGNNSPSYKLNELKFKLDFDIDSCIVVSSILGLDDSFVYPTLDEILNK